MKRAENRNLRFSAFLLVRRGRSVLTVSTKDEEITSGEKLIEYTIQNEKFKVRLLNYGATLRAIELPNEAGVFENIILAHANNQDYLKERSFLGASVGRVAGRIKKGEWGTVQLDQNEGVNHLHGGDIGFDNVYWEATISRKKESVTVSFTHFFASGVGGYPGNLKMTIHYVIYETKELKIIFEGVTDQKTLLNPTNHAYFNLSGGKEPTIASHELFLASDFYLPLEADHLPTGEVLKKIKLLEQAELLGNILKSSHLEIYQEDGLNHAFLLKKGVKPSVILSHTQSNRKLKITTSYPSVVCYTGNHFSDDDFGKHSAIALEFQKVPDVDHFDYLGSHILNKETKYSEFIHYVF